MGHSIWVVFDTNTPRHFPLLDLNENRGDCPATQFPLECIRSRAPQLILGRPPSNTQNSHPILQNGPRNKRWNLGWRICASKENTKDFAFLKLRPTHKFRKTQTRSRPGGLTQRDQVMAEGLRRPRKVRNVFLHSPTTTFAP